MSKSGKYVLRLYFNGCYRKVTIDDHLPSSLSCEHSLHVIDRNSPGLLWPALVEKAYLKVRHGYDFPGSNSGTDLWALTGWIPQQVFVHDEDVVLEELWSQMLGASHEGHVLLTAGTGQMSTREEEELGLVSLHDYAILDLRDNNHGKRQFLLKNPWADGTVWREPDSMTATVAAADAETTDKDLLGRFSNLGLSSGTFWIDADIVFQNFDHIYMNWDPCLFEYREDIHFSWDISQTTKNSSIIDHPQFALSRTGAGNVWLLLARHFRSGDYAAYSKPGFISIYVFDENGRRIFLSNGALLRAALVDSPNTLIKIEMPAETSYTVVPVVDSLPRVKHNFSLSALSNAPINITPARDKYAYKNALNSEWTASTAGGNTESSRYLLNPQFSLEVSEPDINLAILLENRDASFATHVKLFHTNRPGQRVFRMLSRDILIDSGDYRHGCALAEVEDIPRGYYVISCSTFEPDQIGRFTLSVHSTKPCYVKPLPNEGAGRLRVASKPGMLAPGGWKIAAPLHVSRLTRSCFIARKIGDEDPHQTHVSPSLPIRFTVEVGGENIPGWRTIGMSENEDYSDSVMGARIEDTDLHPSKGPGNIWIVVELDGGRHASSEVWVEVEMLTDNLVGIGEWKTLCGT